MDVQSRPQPPATGDATEVRVLVRYNGQPQLTFERRDGAGLHLFVIPHTLLQAKVYHPEFAPETGVFTASVTSSETEPYLLVATAVPEGQPSVTLRSQIHVDTRVRPSAVFAVDDGPQEAEGYTVTPEVASPLVSGVDLLLISNIARSNVADPLAAKIELSTAHAVIVRVGALDVVPTRPVTSGGHGGMVSLDPNQIAFATTIPAPGRYRVFTFVEVDGRSIAVANTFEAVAVPSGALLETEGEAGHSMGDDVQTFHVEAFQWDYAPSVLRAHLGTQIRLILTSRDVPHSFNLEGYDLTQTIMPDRTSTLEFLADRPGSFSFGCDVACGSGHGRMQHDGGVLIVE